MQLLVTRLKFSTVSALSATIPQTYYEDFVEKKTLSASISNPVNLEPVKDSKVT